jgi:hypothetical protein
MTGGIFQLKAKGIQDLYLYEDTGYNFIKQVYRKCENFSSQLNNLQFNNEVNFGNKIDIIIPRKGDYLYKLYLKVTLPPLQKTSGKFTGWVNSIGHALIDYVQVIIGDQVVDTQTGLYMEIMDELNQHPSLNSAENLLVGRFNHNESLEYNALIESTYEIPLKFWFNENLNSSLPLLALMYHNVKISIKLKNFDELVVYDGITPPETVRITSASLLAEYIYVDDALRTTEMNKSHEFLVSQTQFIKESVVNPSGSINSFLLNFNHPSKEIIFVLRETDSEDNNDWFNFSKRNVTLPSPTLPILDKAKLTLDGNERIPLNDDFTLRITSGFRYRGYATNKHIYTMSFCNEPDKWYPNGSLNFSTVDEARLTIHTKNGITSPVNLFVFCRNFNIVTISNGMFGLAFSS